MLLTIVTSLIVLSILVIAHELGHFLPAKKSGIRVEEFGLGYPPRVWAKKVGKTLYSLNLLPVGGFVRLFGEELDKSRDKKILAAKDSFWAQSKKVRLAVISGGVMANFILAVIVFTIVYSVVGIPVETDRVSVIGVLPESPAAEVGLMEEDILVSINGQAINSLDQFTDLLEANEGQEVILKFEREGEKMAALIAPRESPPENEGPLGIVISNVQMIHYPMWQMPFRGAIEGFKEAYNWLVLIIQGLGEMIGDLVTQGKLPRDVAGPVGIFQITGRVAEAGYLSLLQFIGILSVNLAVINFLPFPALDGGRFLFVVYEVLTGRRPKPEFERWANSVGMALILILVLLATVNDLVRIWETTNIAIQLQQLWPY
jgi:regulator of sigma E protease